MSDGSSHGFSAAFGLAVGVYVAGILGVGILGSSMIPGGRLWAATQETQQEATVVASFPKLARQYENEVLPLLRKLCFECHNSEDLEGELDLDRFRDLTLIRTEPSVWQNVLVQIESGEMPPEDAGQGTDDDRRLLIAWVEQFLRAEAFAGAGDPGPVVLRRLSNAEYGYSISDLTGLEYLDATEAFPVDGASGEGFTNSGAGLVMSPSLFTKYLNAAKEVASHAILLPDSIGFSEKVSRRDRTEEKLAQIRNLYARFTSPGGDAKLNLQGVRFDTKDAGVVDLRPYLLATIEFRDAIMLGEKSISDVAQQRNLNARYLQSIWETLRSSDDSIVLGPIRQQWNASKPEDVDAIGDSIAQWQRALWQFTTVGHIGKRDGPTAWQEPIAPVAKSHEVRMALSAPNAERGTVGLYLITSDAGDGDDHDVVQWKEPRLTQGNSPPIPLSDANRLGKHVRQLQQKELGRTADYLSGLAEARRDDVDIAGVVQRRGLDARVMQRWEDWLDMGQMVAPKPTGHFENRLANVGGYAEVSGWGFAETPSVIANRGDGTVRFSTLTVPARSVLVHPSPSQQAIVAWQYPGDSSGGNGQIQIEGMIADADGNCGNGVAWSIRWFSKNNAAGAVLKSGVVENGGAVSFAVDSTVDMQAGDFIQLVIDPRDGEHVCDTTQVDLRLTESAKGEASGRSWGLATDCVDGITTSNPLADAFGNKDVWHFCSSVAVDKPEKVSLDGTSLQAWKQSVLADGPVEDTDRLAHAVQRLLTESSGEARQLVSDKDLVLRQWVNDWHGPIAWWDLGRDGFSLSTTDDVLWTRPGVIAYELDAHFSGAEFAASVSLLTDEGTEGSVQAWVQSMPPHVDTNLVDLNYPILVNPQSEAEKRILQQCEQFRQIFPAAMCYTKIVPVDEVVTLTLFYREDEALARLMLDPTEQRELDRLWDELHFISHDALALVDAYEQLWQYATQDADPSAFEPMRQPILDRAQRFRTTLLEAEPRHVASLARFAAQAWRQPRSAEIDAKVRSFYDGLRNEELDHEEAIRLTMARVLVAPEFLYKMERPGEGKQASDISDAELATRLSYFLWSSVPDQALARVVESGGFHGSEADGKAIAIKGQARRMIADARVRRLALEFACQWLGVRDFDSLDEKSERHFPEFLGLRESMREEAIQFFTDLFQNDRSILSILDAQHAFVDEKLADFYELRELHAGEPQTGIQQVGWRRVDGIHERGRGGVLGMAAILARQSGASRTSPILRGNWVYEVLLGQHLPRPPKNVPQLPEEVPEGLTERELIERHSRDPACAKCHEKIDGYGFALEGFDAIGRQRRSSQTVTTLPGGTQIEGLEGLRSYLMDRQKDTFVRQFCRKMLGYALGRSVLLSDEPLIESMMKDLREQDFRVGVAVDRIVTSPQFMQIRGTEFLLAE